MASVNHTARTHAPVRNEPRTSSTASIDGTLYPLSLARERRLTHVQRLAGTALAATVIEGMLKTHRAFQQKHQNGEKSGLFPLDPAQLNGLNAALYFLRHYVDTLRSEQGG
ncbi:hypothetical protein ACFFJT_06500 [Dyella flava]|uniref:CRISPR type III-B/RAMP module-associated protein Cmr5 n=1 Tax=Dyella flava TaxID=1920170 RepID=A0ABS2JYM5_9GAMM|nr:hypothetical protein [Dyella flava]MBM7124097.1 hypothetical protein [Dyella flava]GLQ49997.1 hypothetical protein GCM10010872_14460 [Dyella flava]